MQRSIPIGMGLLAISLAATLSGCGETGAEGEQAAARGGAPERDGTEVLAIQTGSRAALRRGPGNSLELTIDRPSPRTLYFTDSPERRAQTAPVGHLPTWVKQRTAKQGQPANVALSWHGRGDPGSLAATLREVSYESGRLRTTLDPIEVRSGVPASLRNDRLGIEPFSNRTVSLVFDGSDSSRCFAEIYSGEGDFWNLEGSSVEHHDWDRSPPETIGREAVIGAESTSIWYGCEFSVRYGDGEGSGFTIKVDNPLVGSASYSCQGFGNASCDPDTVYHEGRNEAFMEAVISYKP